MAENVENVQKRERSAQYPSFTIETCLEFIKGIDSLGGRVVSYASICDLLGITSPTTRSFLGRISTSKQFGFITTSSNTVQLTDLARRILNPVDTGEEKQLLIEAFSSPPLYAKLIERFENKAIPNKEQLSNLLMHEHKIIKQVKDVAAECFIESASFVGVVQNGVLCLNTEDITEYQNESLKEDISELLQGQEEALQLHTSELKKANTYTFTIPLFSGQVVSILIPKGVSERDLDYIGKNIGMMMPDFIEYCKENLKEEQNNE